MEKEVRARLIKLAINNTIGLLSQYGNNLNDSHKKAIKKIIVGFVYLLENKNEKIAFPLFCGGGKSTCIRGLIKALHQLGLDYGIVVSANQVEALCEMKRSLLNDGIPLDRIGLIHSKDSASLASDNKEEASNKQFVLVTHNRIKQNNSLDSYFYYKERKRDLVIWDESLLSGESICMSAERVRKMLSDAKIVYEHRIIGTENEKDYSVLIGYFSDIDNRIKAAQSQEDKDFQIIFEKAPASILSIVEKIKSLLSSSGEELISLIDYINKEEHIRYISTHL